MAPHSSSLAWKISWHGRRSLVGFSPWGRWVRQDWGTSLSLSSIGEGNGTPLQCSCLENPRDGGAWWAAVYGVTQSRARLKRLSSSSSSKGSTAPVTLGFLLFPDCVLHFTSLALVQMLIPLWRVPFYMNSKLVKILLSFKNQHKFCYFLCSA